METNWSKHFFRFIKKHYDKPWDWEILSSNPNITWDIVEATPDKQWDWFALSENPNITIEIIQQIPDKYWSWGALSRNNFEKEKEMFELRVKHQRFVQEHLFEEFVKVYMHPTRIQKLLDTGYTIDELDDIL